MHSSTSLQRGPCFCDSLASPPVQKGLKTIYFYCRGAQLWSSRPPQQARFSGYPCVSTGGSISPYLSTAGSVGRKLSHLC
ncbi:hypothetical protein FKM82_002440 [Ascaphus truei]